MESASHAVYGTSIFPTMRRGSDLRNRRPATRRQLRLDARPAPSANGGPRRLGDQPSGKVRWRPRGTRSPACRTTARRRHANNGEDASAGGSTGREDPTFQGVSTTSWRYPDPWDAAAIGVPKHSWRASQGVPGKGVEWAGHGASALRLPLFRDREGLPTSVTDTVSGSPIPRRQDGRGSTPSR